MKNHLLLPALSAGLTLLFTPARADDAAPTTLTPEMQKLIAQLLKAAAESRQDPAPAAEPAPKEAKASTPVTAKGSLQTGGLTTGRLTTAMLTPSAPLDGRGTTGGTPRFSAEEWRALFASKPVRR